MKKYYIKPIIILCTMVIMVLSLNFLSKDKIDIKTIEGNINEMDNVSLVYVPRIKDLKKEEIVINKDGVKNYNKKDYPIGRDYVNIDIKDSKFIKGKYKGSIYEDNNYIGSVNLEYEYDKNSNSLFPQIKLERKNKKTQEIEKINIPINNIDKDRDNLELIFKAVYKNDMYLFVSASPSDPNKYETLNNKLFVIKVNADKKEANIVQEKEVNHYLSAINLKFVNDNKVYLQIPKEIDEVYYSSFLVYDMINNTLTETKNPKKEKDVEIYLYDVLDYKVENNKLNVFVKKRDKSISKIVYSIKEDDIVRDRIEDFDFKIEYAYHYNNDFYSLGTDETGGIKKFEVINDKIYSLYQNVSVLNRTTKNGVHMIIQGNKPIKVEIFDMKLNKVVYKGEINGGDKFLGRDLYIAKNY